MADFLRKIARNLPDITILAFKALELINFIQKCYSNKLYLFESETQIMNYDMIKDFIEYYNVSRHLLLNIKNACSE